MRSVASENIDAVHVVSLFSKAVVAPSGKMREHVACLEKLFEITVILDKPQDIMMNVDTLEVTLSEHRRLSNDLYTCTPKGHYILDVPACIRVHGFLASCFAPERDHHVSKTVARNCFRNYMNTILHRCNYKFFEALINDEKLFSEVYLISAVAGHTQLHTMSDKAMTHIGILSKGDYVFVGVDGVTVLCAIEMFVVERVICGGDGKLCSLRASRRSQTRAQRPGPRDQRRFGK